MAREVDETLEFPFGSGAKSGCGGFRDEGAAHPHASAPATYGRPAMKLTVFAPTGSAGEQIVRPAPAAGHEATAVARRPDAAAPADPWLRVLAGDVLDPASPRDGTVGCDIEPGLNKQQPYVV